MGKEVVVTDILSREMIDAGAELLCALDSTLGVVIDDAFWLRQSEEDRWYLVLASPGASVEGPMKSYGDIQLVLRDIPDSASVIGLQDIRVLDSSHQTVQTLRSELRSLPSAEGYRLVRAYLKRIYFEDLYVYRIVQTIQLECPVDLAGPMESVIGSDVDDLYVRVEAQDFDGVPNHKTIAYTTLKKLDGRLIATMELPVQYGVVDPAQVRCEAFTMPSNWEDSPVHSSIMSIRISTV